MSSRHADTSTIYATPHCPDRFLNRLLRRYSTHRDVLLSRLYPLRAAERAAFRGLRFEVHTLAATRIDSQDGSGE